METMHTESRPPRRARRVVPRRDREPEVPQRLEVRRGLAGVAQSWVLARRARRASTVPFSGATEDEPNVAAFLRETEGYVAARLRTDAELQAAQAAVAATTSALAEATNSAGGVDLRTADAIAAAVGIDPHDPTHEVVWTAGARARAERIAARDAEVAARRALAAATERYQTESSRSIEAALVDAEAGVGVAGVYLERYNAACARRGHPGIGVLGRDVAEDIVRRAIRPLDLAQEPGPVPGVRRRDADPVLPRPGTAHLYVA